MREATHLACIEVAVRDVNAGKILISRKGKILIQKELLEEELRRKRKGEEAVREIFSATGAKEVVEGSLPFGLHLMGGCAIGVDPKVSVVNPDFALHNDPSVYIADSSIFPSAPGINPSLTIMALSLKASESMLKS
jgi:choline dehydrogenase-like flavoprotein